MSATKSSEHGPMRAGRLGMNRQASPPSLRRSANVMGLKVVADGGRAVASGPALLEAAQALYVDGDLQRSRDRFDAAFRSAEREGDTATMALAALGMAGLWVHEHRGVAACALVDGRLRHAVDSIGAGSTLQLRLRARIAAESDYRTGGHSAILEMVQEARNHGDPVALAEAVSLAHHCVLGPDHDKLRRALADELIGAALRTGRRSDLLMGIMWRTIDMYLDGDLHAGRCLSELRELLAQKDHLAANFVVNAVEVMLYIREGQFEQAERLAQRCAQSGRVAGDVDATGWHGAQMVSIRWYQGRIGELLPTLQESVNSPELSTVDHAHVAALAVAAAAADQPRLAAAALAQLRRDGLHRLPRSSSWLVSMYAVAEAASMLNDTEAMATVYDLLLPYAHLPAMASLGVTCFGSVQHALGVAALGMGATDKAIDHCRAAVRSNLALNHWPAVTLSRSRLAQALLRRDGGDDRHEAELELETFRRDAAALGMPSATPAIGAPGTPVAVRGGRRQLITCQRDGKRWLLRFGGQSWLFGDSLGMSYIAVLLANPGYEVSALELAAGAGVPYPAPVEGPATPAQPFLDEAAMRSYRARLSAVQAEIDEYEAMNDLIRVERARAEYSRLVSELTAATRPDRRPRQLGGSEERARISVGKAIRRAIAKVTAAAPRVGQELASTVLTGLRCSYQPR